jgi:nucleotide-binding universal stress UspA family protein
MADSCGSWQHSDTHHRSYAPVLALDATSRSKPGDAGSPVEGLGVGPSLFFAPGRRETVLVYHDGYPVSDGLVPVAQELAGPAGRVIVLALTVVPDSLPLQDLPDDVDEPALNALESARAAALGSPPEIESRITRGRNPAKMVVAEALDVDATIILLAEPHPRFSWLPHKLSRIARDALPMAPCPVFIVHLPDEGVRNGGVPPQPGRVPERAW